MAELEPDFKYHRVLDLDAGLRLFGTVLWLRRHSDVDPKAAFESRPASLRSAHHDFEIDVDSSALRMRTLAKRPTDVWSIPYATPRGESGMGETLSPRQDRH